VWDADLGRYVDPLYEQWAAEAWARYEANRPHSVGAPGFAESLIPVWGSGRAAVNDFQEGRWGWGVINAALAVSDVFLVKSLATAGGKLVVKGGAKLLGRETVEQAGTVVARQTCQEVVKRAPATMLQSGELRGTEAASKELIESVAGKGRTISYARPGSDELRYLDAMRANANVGGDKLTHILLREDPRKIEVLEEFLHGTQQRAGIIDRLGADGAEVHVKEFMIRHQRLLGLSPEDVKVLQQMIGR